MRMLKNKVAAFTLVDSLLTLGVTVFLATTVSGQVSQVFSSVEQTLFYLSFEHLYRDSQKLAAAQQEELSLTISHQSISNGYEVVNVPKGIRVLENAIIRFDQTGGNSSLKKVVILEADHEVTYQLYLGSGNYKKTKR